jgi:hypothetical protein
VARNVDQVQQVMVALPHESNVHQRIRFQLPAMRQHVIEQVPLTAIADAAGRSAATPEGKVRWGNCFAFYSPLAL